MNAGHAVIGGEGEVYQMGVSAYNGKIYALSRAMTPLVETVYDRLVDGGRSSLMVEALKATGWDKRLSTVVDTIYDEKNSRIITHRYFTVLNVSDAAFQRAGIGSLDELRSKLRENDKSRGRGLQIPSNSDTLFNSGPWERFSEVSRC